MFIADACVARSVTWVELLSLEMRLTVVVTRGEASFLGSTHLLRGTALLVIVLMYTIFGIQLLAKHRRALDIHTLDGRFVGPETQSGNRSKLTLWSLNVSYQFFWQEH